jgi:hypothetical protein
MWQVNSGAPEWYDSSLPLLAPVVVVTIKRSSNSKIPHIIAIFKKVMPPTLHQSLDIFNKLYYQNIALSWIE